MLLEQVSQQQAIHNYKICVDAPAISHLLSADDIVIFCREEEDQALVIKDIISKYELTTC